jgi:DMSO reductase anchor subunit
MIHWFEHLPIGWMSLVVFAVIYLVAGGIYWLVMALAVGERARAFKAISPGMLPPLGIIFGLLVAFMAAQVWGDLDRAHAA